ncbi:B962L [African swine fever virus]|uniref:B962L n=1 Tax=African swine fever virus TaxID=10497 RepID=A0A5B8XEM5_ASF|nr:B962L [African swine fever virus]
MLDPPPTDALASAIERAIVAGLLTRGEKGLQLTQLGDIASRFSFLSIEEARMCFSGYFWQAAISDIATILAVVSVADKKLTNLLDSKQRNGAMLAEAGFGRHSAVSTKY